MKGLDIQIEHSIPGRLRLRLTRPPKAVNDFIEKVKRHEGMDAVAFNPVTLSMLASYNPAIVSTIEIVVRVGIALSIDYNGTGVYISRKEQGRALSLIDYYAMGSLIAGGICKAIRPNTAISGVLAYNAGFSTLFAVLGHAWAEVRKEGLYDPEAISVIYLINSLIKGNFLMAGAITWIATFGRHIMTGSHQVCVLEASEITGEDRQTYVEVVIKPILANTFDNNPIKLLVAGLGHVVGLNHTKSQYNMMEQIQQMSRKHGNVLEGIGHKPGPVYMRLNQ